MAELLKREKKKKDWELESFYFISEIKGGNTKSMIRFKNR